MQFGQMFFFFGVGLQQRGGETGENLCVRAAEPETARVPGADDDSPAAPSFTAAPDLV